MTVSAETTPVSERVARLHRALASSFINRLKAAGFEDVTPAFAAIMPFIDVDGSSQVEVARKAGLSKQAVGQLIKELVVRRYLQLDRGAEDTRYTSVRFTERGLELRQQGFKIKAEQQNRIESWLGPEHIDGFSGGLDKLLVALDCNTASDY